MFITYCRVRRRAPGSPGGACKLRAAVYIRCHKKFRRSRKQARTRQDKRDTRNEPCRSVQHRMPRRSIRARYKDPSPRIPRRKPLPQTSWPSRPLFSARIPTKKCARPSSRQVASPARSPGDTRNELSRTCLLHILPPACISRSCKGLHLRENILT